jgi:hypothetical protein
MVVVGATGAPVIGIRVALVVSKQPAADLAVIL